MRAASKIDRLRGKRLLSKKKAARRRERVAPVPTLREVLAARDAEVRAGRFRFLGRMGHIRTTHGAVLELYKTGPAMAQLESGEIVMLEAFRGLPARPDLETRKLCPDCATKCDECNGRGERICCHPGCGGEGTIMVHMAQPRIECPNCRGKKIAPCTLCWSTGKMSTGHVDGALDKRNTALCATCRGAGVTFEMREQSLRSHLVGTIEGMAMLGPIASIAIIPTSGGDETGVLAPLTDMEGRSMVMLIEGQSAWLYGGVPRLIMG